MNRADIITVPEDTLDRLLMGKATEGDQLLAHNSIRSSAAEADATYWKSQHTTLLTAYNELLAAKGWLPIESAPKDGTRILVYSPQSPPPGIYACYWGVSEQAWLFDVGLGAYQPRTSAATHWQPLPPAPGSDGGL